MKEYELPDAHVILSDDLRNMQVKQGYGIMYFSTPRGKDTSEDIYLELEKGWLPGWVALHDLMEDYHMEYRNTSWTVDPYTKGAEVFKVPEAQVLIAGGSVSVYHKNMISIYVPVNKDNTNALIESLKSPDNSYSDIQYYILRHEFKLLLELQTSKEYSEE